MSKNIKCPYCGQYVRDDIPMSERLAHDPELRQIITTLLRLTILFSALFFVMGISCVIIMNLVF